MHVTLLIWNGFPVLIIGGSDAKRRLFPIAIAVCSAEKHFELPPIVTSPRPILGIKVYSRSPFIIHSHKCKIAEKELQFCLQYLLTKFSEDRVEIRIIIININAYNRII